jgi:ATP-dependent DNA ligase
MKYKLEYSVLIPGAERYILAAAHNVFRLAAEFCTGFCTGSVEKKFHRRTLSREIRRVHWYLHFPLAPMRLAVISQPFDDPDWIFELKFDGFRAIADLTGESARLFSRNGVVYKAFRPLCPELTGLGMNAVLDGEITCVDEAGRPQFYDLLRRRGQPVFVAFDILEREGRDLRLLPLIERKRILHQTVRTSGHILCPQHVDGAGTELFRRCCELDLEGIVAKWKHGSYVTGDAQPQDRSLRRAVLDSDSLQHLTWLKIQNPGYTQAGDRGELFKPRVAA